MSRNGPCATGWDDNVQLATWGTGQHGLQHSQNGYWEPTGEPTSGWYQNHAQSTGGWSTLQDVVRARPTGPAHVQSSVSEPATPTSTVVLQEEPTTVVKMQGTARRMPTATNPTLTPSPVSRVTDIETDSSVAITGTGLVLEEAVE